MDGSWMARLLLTGIMLSLLILPSSVDAQVTFERAYGAPGSYDYGHCVQQTRDDGYVIAGVGAFNLIKLNPRGDSLWSRSYGIPGSIEVFMYCVRQTPDRGYILAGAFRSVDPNDRGDGLLLKTDSTGHTVWSKAFGGDSMDYVHWVEQTLDGGYILVGFTESFADSCWDVWLIRTDSLGNTLWTRTYGSPGCDVGVSVQETSDGGFIITGEMNHDYGTDTGDLYLMKTDSQGNTLWTKTYGPPGVWNRGESVRQTLDGGYVAVGTAFFSIWQIGTDMVYLLKVDSNGDTLWSKTFYGNGRARGRCVQQTLDGGYVVAGKTWQSGVSLDDVYLIKTDYVGDILWDTTFGGLDFDQGYSVWHTSDSGYAVAGMVGAFGIHSQDYYLVKTDKRGWFIPELDYGVVSLDSPPDTVFTNSWCEVMATIQSYSNVMDSIVVFASIDGYADTLWDVELDPGSSFQVHFGNWLVPSADSTTYDMTVCVHNEDDIDTSNDCMQKTIFAYRPTGVEEELSHGPRNIDFRLDQNEPNPFHGSTTISYSLPAASRVSLQVYDISGRLVETLVDGTQKAGVYQVQWESKDKTTGVYFYRLKAGDLTDTEKMLLLR